MEGVIVVDHPLVQHKLTLMRDKNRSTKGFRQLLNEIGRLLCYEVTRDLPLEMVEIETPLTKMQAPRVAGKKLVLAPILLIETLWLMPLWQSLAIVLPVMIGVTLIALPHIKGAVLGALSAVGSSGSA